ncbi:E3 ubiquitin-protein ligase Topors-like [Anser cygnoides]|uniref:E3 ubiquitin-protein ligase Topors-like n=1 Tax=Anser cygnoides TaxID=8845 RepID=UPI0034D2CC10
MASGAEERLEESSPAARGSSSQLQQAGPAEDAADCLCPICLDIITDAAYVARCFHRFCSTCIRRWSRQNNTCPLCRQPIERVVRRMPEDHEEHRVGSSARRRRNRARERVRSRSPQERYNSRGRPTSHGPSARRRGPVGPNPASRGGAAAGPANGTSQQARTRRAPRRPTPRRAGWHAAWPVVPVFFHLRMEASGAVHIELFYMQ